MQSKNKCRVQNAELRKKIVPIFDFIVVRKTDKSEFESKTLSNPCRGGVSPPAENALICGRGDPSPTDKFDCFAPYKNNQKLFV